MSSNNHDHNRPLQQDARAWAKFTDARYTAAFRQVSSPLAQGILGERISARHLIDVTKHHNLIGDDGDEPVLSDSGFYAGEPWRFNGQTDYVELALVVDMLRMFTPIGASKAPAVSSYRLKHTIEKFLDPHCSYISNGKVIWAAAALGLPLVEPGNGGPNLLVGISEAEHDYVRRTVDAGRTPPGGHHHRPAGLEHLRAALTTFEAGQPALGRWVRPEPVPAEAPFHDWLTARAGRHDPIGHFADDYAAGVLESDHPIARTADELIEILYELRPSLAAYDAGVAAIAEWLDAAPAATPVRTERVRIEGHDVGGYGAGGGDVERYEHRCPCGMGEIVETHENVPGFREHDVLIHCEKCRNEWRFAKGPVRGWGLLPLAALRER